MLYRYHLNIYRHLEDSCDVTSFKWSYQQDVVILRNVPYPRTMKERVSKRFIPHYQYWQLPLYYYHNTSVRRMFAI